MKLKNKLLPIVALSGIATIAMPLVASCNNGGDTSKVDVEWNEEYESFLDIFQYSTYYDTPTYRQVKWDFPKAILSEEINKNIDDYDVYFVDTKTGNFFKYINQKASYIISNPNDRQYLDLHIFLEAAVPAEEYVDTIWMMTIKIVRKGSQDVVFSKSIYLGEAGDYVDKWNPQVEKKVDFDPATGEYFCDSPFVLPVPQAPDEEKWNWDNTRLYDFELGERIKYVGDSEDPAPFVLKEKTDDHMTYNLTGQWDRLKNTNEPITISLETICHTNAWIVSFIIRVQNITFVPQK